MLVDTGAILPDQVLSAEICIIGAGAAGISIALEFAGTSTDVILLEGGGFDPDPESQALYEGVMSDPRRRMDREYLTRSRLRFFGGSTNHWAGWCRPLDPMDFEKLDWIPHSGWPITSRDLEPFYPRAAELLEIKPFPRDLAAWHDRPRRPIPVGNGRHVTTKVFHFSPPTRFGTLYRESLLSASNVRLLLDASVTNVRTGMGLRHVDHVEVSTLDAKRFKVRARFYILATGGIENARILLNADLDQPRGLGNGSDMVGRFFCDHPITARGHAGEVAVTAADLVEKQETLLSMYHRTKADPVVGCRTKAVFCLSDATLREEKLLPYSLQIRRRKEIKLSKLSKAVCRTVSQLQTGQEGPPPPVYSAVLRSGQAPNPDSRVTLSGKRDALGLRKARLRWRFSQTDLETYRRGAAIMARELGISDFGRLRQEMDLASVKSAFRHTAAGFHHIGTTRMHHDPKQGVVNANCSVHDVQNLYIAGSSVFTTAGLANPTFTIVALALRLAAHIKRRLADGGAP